MKKKKKISEPYQAKNILYRNENINRFYMSRYSINPYRGCLVGCRYCYVQEKKHIDSTGLEEEKDRQVQIKINAPYLLDRKLSTGLRRGVIALGESCEPYGEPEEEYFITRRLLEVLQKYDFPVHLITRSPKVLRDIDLLKKINEKSTVCITVSLPVVSRDLVKKLEGDSPPVKTRLGLLKSIKKHNIYAGLGVSPVLPFISDGKEINKVLKKASVGGADYVLFDPLTIKPFQRDMFFMWLKEKFPNLLESYKKLYEDREYPGSGYWEKFILNAKKRALEYDLNIALPFEENPDSENV
ncbi:MAG: radical SAM protein [Elusimicrobiota bacterium]